MTTRLEIMTIVQYVSIAGAVVYLYDLALTFGAEIQFFWRARIGWVGRHLFLFTRYSPLLGFSAGLLDLNPFVAHLSDQTCRVSRVITIVAQIAISASSTGMFCMRICTLYREKWKMKALMLAWFYLAVAVQVALGFVAISSFITIIEFRGTICAFARPPPKGLHILVAGCFLSVLPCETVILVATYLHAIGAKQKHFLSRESAALPVLRRMYQDGAIYLLIAFGTRLGGSIVWLACPAELKFVSDFLIYSLSSVVSTRFFLGLRQLVHRPTVQTQCPTTLEGSLFVDTYSLPVAMTRNPDPSIRDGIGLSFITPRGPEGGCSLTT